ncbi:MAG: alpha/beta hydrolase [Pseudomonadota bacterium]
MTAIDFEAEYNNRARVPESGEIIASWGRDAAAYRAARDGRWRTLRYGSGERHGLDLFAADADNGAIVVFIHGGYWQALDRSFFSHMARGLNARGVTVAVPSYDLCPQVGVADIVAQMRAAVRELARLNRPLVVSGHSAGGQLSACLLATDWTMVDPALPADLVTSAYALSGVFDLEPLVGTSLNGALRLDAEGARAVSPLRWTPPRRGILDAVVGGAESDEFLRQSRVMADIWGAAGVTTRYEAVPGANHFTIIAPLADPASAMTARLAELAAQAVR